MTEVVAHPPRSRMSKRMTAEAFGTFWLVLGGCGTAVLATGRAVLVCWESRWPSA